MAKVTNPFTGNSYDVHGWQNTANANAQMDTNITNVMLQREQNDWNYRMWQENNEYNSPAAERQRLVEAGYNPLMFGDMGSQTQPAQGSEPAQFDSPQFQSSLPYIMQGIDLLSSNFQNLISQINSDRDFGLRDRMITNDEQRLSFERDYKGALTSLLHKDASWYDIVKNGEVWNKFADTQSKIASADASRATKAFIDKQTSSWDKITDATIHEIQARTRVSEKQVDKMDSDIKLIVQEIVESKSRVALNKSSTKAIDLQNELTSKYGEATANKALQAYDDAHNANFAHQVVSLLGIDKEARDSMAAKLQGYNLSPTEMDEVLFILKDIKDGSVKNPGISKGALDYIKDIAPWAVAAFGLYLKTRTPEVTMGNPVLPTSAPNVSTTFP